MKRSGSPGLNGTHSAPVLAGLHRQGSSWRVIIARRAAQWEVIESRETDPAGMTALLSQHSVSRVIHVIPGQETVCRCLPLPMGDDDQVIGALSLLAEAELPASLPPHRRAAGFLSGDVRGDMGTALLTGWMGGTQEAKLAGVSEGWTTVVAALSALKGDAGRAAVYADSVEGVITALVSGPQRTAARVLIEQNESRGAWASAVQGAAAETGELAGVGAGPMAIAAAIQRNPDKKLHLEPASVAALRSQVLGVREESAWLDSYGLALGALLVAGSVRRSERSLAEMTVSARVEERTPVQSVTAWLGDPRKAWGVLAAACILMLLGPLGLSWGRLALLDSRTARLAEMRVGREAMERSAAMYSQLERSRWPMTKLLADVSGATPVGITVTNLRLSPEQGLAIQGTADAADLVNTLQANLNKTRLFSNIKINRVESKSQSLAEFDVTADVTQPHAPSKPVEDFAARTLAQRMYGEGASNTSMPVARTDEGSGSRRRVERGGSERPTAERANGGEQADSRPSEAGSRRPSSMPEAVPPPVSDEDIAKMDRSAAMKGWTNRKSYIQKNPGLDAATKQRLEDEVTKMRARQQAAGSGG